MIGARIRVSSKLIETKRGRGSEQKSRQEKGAIMYRRLLGSWILSRPACGCHHLPPARHASRSAPPYAPVTSRAPFPSPNHSRRRRVPRGRNRNRNRPPVFFALGAGGIEWCGRRGGQDTWVTGSGPCRRGAMQEPRRRRFWAPLVFLCQLPDVSVFCCLGLNFE